MESINVTDFFKNVYTLISNRLQDMQLVGYQPIDYSSIYPRDITTLNLGIVIFLIVISVLSLYKLATIDREIYETVTVRETKDESYHESQYSTFQAQSAKFDCCPPQKFSFSSSVDRDSEPIVFTDPFAAQPLEIASYQRHSRYDLRSRPTPRTEKGWYESAQQSTRGHQSGDKRKAALEGKWFGRKKSRKGLFVSTETGR